jgi:hypothetical protein
MENYNTRASNRILKILAVSLLVSFVLVPALYAQDINDLISKLGDKEYRVRKEAVKVLSKIGEPAVIRETGTGIKIYN